MTGNIKYIIDWSEGRLKNRAQRKYEKELMKDKTLFQGNIALNQFNKYMRAKFDLEDARNDPALPTIEPYIEEILSRYNTKQDKYRINRKFIEDSLNNDGSSDRDQKEEIECIKQEINELGIDHISKEWVKEWNERKHSDENLNENIRKIRDYITGSLKSVFDSTEKATEHKRISNWEGIHLKRMLVLAAAAVIALFCVFKVLVPANDPEKLYEKYYEPMSALLPVTRNMNASLMAKFTEGVEMYNKGNFKTAAIIFTDLIQQDSSSTVIQFFAGITQMEIGDYSRASALLSKLISITSDYQKDAQWYLGLSCLHTGDKSKAVSCFEALSGSEGFYQNKARNLLRRLK